jgi:membrane protein
MRNAAAGGGWPLKHVRQYRNMATPQRSPLWPFVAYCALALVMLAMPERPNDAKGRPETDRANATSGEPSDSEREIDRSRAAERGRGRQATSPLRIPWRGWKDILWRVYEKMNDNRLLAVAAGVVFYALLALFPAVTAFVSLYGLVADASTIDRHLSLASGIMPSGAVDILHEQLTRLTSSRTSALSFGFVFGLLFALWSANSGTKAVIDGLNVAYEEAEQRGFIRLNLVSLGFTLGAFLALTLAVGAVVVAPIVLTHLGLGGVADTLVRLLRWPVSPSPASSAATDGLRCGLRLVVCEPSGGVVAPDALQVFVVLVCGHGFPSGIKSRPLLGIMREEFAVVAKAFGEVDIALLST